MDTRTDLELVKNYLGVDKIYLGMDKFHLGAEKCNRVPDRCPTAFIAVVTKRSNRSGVRIDPVTYGPVWKFTVMILRGFEEN